MRVLCLLQSQDIKLLKDEMSRGFEYLDQLAELRDQCASLAWKKEVDTLKKCSKWASCDLFLLWLQILLLA